MKCLLRTDIATKIAYVGNKFSTCFGVRDVTDIKHNHGIICQGRSPEIGCNDHYLGETDGRISERVLKHAGRNHNSYRFKYFIENGHSVLDGNNCKITEEGYKNNVRKPNTALALLIKENESYTK